MVQFNELKIVPDGTKLIIDVSIKDLSYYNNVYIDKILIDTQDTFVESGPSSNARSISVNSKKIRLELGKGDVPSLTNNLFFVYVKTRGIPSPDTPCGMDNSIILGTTLYPYRIYCNMLKTIQLEYSNSCSPPRKFIDRFFRYKGLQLALITGNNLQAIKYFNGFSDNPSISLTSNTCKCYGN